MHKMISGWVLAFVISLAPVCLSAENMLDRYVNFPDKSFSYKVVKHEKTAWGQHAEILMTSQIWQGITWRHRMYVSVPANPKFTDKAILFISGGTNSPDGQPSAANKDSLPNAKHLAETISCPAVVLEQVPNQPLFDGKYEDAIISQTFLNYFLTGDGQWPLLFPMVKSAVRAMDATDDLLLKELQMEIKSYVVTGFSKRGWTTWLTAAVDKRVIGLMPMVIEVPNMPGMLEHQKRTLGKYRGNIGDYTSLPLEEYLDAERGKELLAAVDPYSHFARINQPKLLGFGTNDKFWVVDATNVYLKDIKGETRLYYNANSNHSVGDDGYKTAMMFTRLLMSGEKIPAVAWERVGGILKVTCDAQKVTARHWSASSATRDFSDSEWTSAELKAEKTEDGKTAWSMPVGKPDEGYRAGYVECIIRNDGKFPLRFCSPIVITPNTYPADKEHTPPTP